MGKFNLKSLQKRIVSALILIPIVLFLLVMGGLPLILMLLTFFCFSVYEWQYIVRQVEGIKARFIFATIGVLYLPLCFYSFYWLNANQEPSFQLGILLIVLVWLSDTGAYFGGKIIGGRKLLPAVSPNKTWAGFAFAIIAPVLFIPVLAPYFLPELQGLGMLPINVRHPPEMLTTTAVLIGVSSQLGDLFISFLKRKAKIKDTGTVIPGHGGVLDRIDGLLLASAVFAGFFYLYWFL